MYVRSIIIYVMDSPIQVFENEPIYYKLSHVGTKKNVKDANASTDCAKNWFKVVTNIFTEIIF